MGVNRYLGGVITANQNPPTVESASGTWTLEEAYQNIGNWPMALNTVYDSLKFNSADSAYLSRTPTVASNRKTYTFSLWAKRGTLSTRQNFFSVNSPSSGNNGFSFEWLDNNTIGVFFDDGVVAATYIGTTPVYRDPSSWYHVVLAVDATQATSGDRVKIYVNGVSVAYSFLFGSAAITNVNTLVNSTNQHNIGASQRGTSTIDQYLNGYLTEFNFIDGLALDADYFGFFDANGIWQPRAYKGAYGTNGFYLPMRESATAAGFSTVTYTGNSSTNNVTGVGFAPDLVWLKVRNDAQNHRLFDIVRGANKRLMSSSTAAEATTTDELSAFGNDGFTLGANTDVNGSAYNYVGWCWDAGSSTVTNNDGTITGAQVRANPTYGFSIVTWTNASNGDATVGHGLGTAPKLIITKKRSTTNDWYTFTTAIDGSYDYLKLNATDAKVDSTKAAPTSTVFTTDMGDTSTAVAYAFADVTGYSKISTYSGTGTDPKVVTGLGFSPAFVMIKRTDSAPVGNENWIMYDTTRNPTYASGTGSLLSANSSAAQVSNYIEATSDGFIVHANDSRNNASGGTYLYMAFADTRAYSAFDDYSGNGNNWQPNNIGTDDVYVDVPTNWGTDTGVGGEVRGNYCTWNPVNGVTASLTNGNLTLTYSSAGGALGTMAFPSTGKWYWEVTVTGGGNNRIGICLSSLSGTDSYNVGTGTFIYVGLNGNKYTNGSASAYGATYTAGDIIGVAVDADAGTVVFYKNNTSQGTAFTGLSFSSGYSPTVSTNTAGGSMTANFGATPFVYTAPSGFKALCTQNLPEPTIADGGNYFNPVLYTGTGSARSVTGVGFQPDFTWIKGRSFVSYNGLIDAVRGRSKDVYSNSTSAEETSGSTEDLTSFDADGFSLGTSARFASNNNGETYVAWNWKANGAGSSNTAGTISSTVSANTTSGFSIVTYTGNATSGATVGHGLSAQPSMIIVKDRTNGTKPWAVYHSSVSGAPGNILYLNSTSGANADNQFDVTPTSTVFSLGSGTYTNNSGDNYVAYCFAPIAGYSAFGSYTANANADGPFIYLGFRPRFVMFKSSSNTDNWVIFDTARDTYNVCGDILYPNLSNAEVDSPPRIDVVSNGIKVRAPSGYTPNETNGWTYIYAAFAENPFKISRAR